MTDYLFYLLLGTGAGAIMAAFGLGLVITFQGSGVVNFAHGAMAMWIAYVYADLRDGSYPFPIPGLPGRYHFGSDDIGFLPAMGLAMLTARCSRLGRIAPKLNPAPAVAARIASGVSRPADASAHRIAERMPLRQ